MRDLSEYPPISEVTKDKDDTRLKNLVDEYEPDGWQKVVQEIAIDICLDPSWLLDKNSVDGYQVEFNQRLINLVEENGISSLDDLSKFRIDTNAKVAFVMRFMEIFSEKYDYPYVWRGGELDNLDGGVRGTFTFFAGEAKRRVKHSYGGDRRNPCLIGLPVSAIIEDFKSRKGRSALIAEHGWDGIFSASFDISISGGLPDGTMIYLPD